MKRITMLLSSYIGALLVCLKSMTLETLNLFMVVAFLPGYHAMINFV